jgi:hypothetical protein
MLNTEQTATRTLTLVLPEAEWRALRAVEPDALGWLQARVRERLNAAVGAPIRPAAGDSGESWDDY